MNPQIDPGEPLPLPQTATASPRQRQVASLRRHPRQTETKNNI